MLAAMTRAIARASVAESAWSRTRKPAVAATAGSRLIRMAKVAAGRRRSASSSRVYGSTEDMTATAPPRATVVGSISRVPDSAIPSGRNATAATTMASASPSAWGSVGPYAR